MYPKESTLAALLVTLLCGPAEAAASPPDITGIWEPAYIGASEQTGERQRRAKPELTPEYEAQWDRLKTIYAGAEVGEALNARDYPIIRRMVGECVPYGMPQMMDDTGDGASETMDITRSKQHYVIVGEGGLGEHVRRIWLDRKQVPVEAAEPGYFGRSVGKWEGNVLVVNTVGIKKDLELQDIMPHSEKTVITERISLKDGILTDEITITDPIALKKPYTFTSHFKRIQNDYEPSEGFCDNSNHYRFDKDGKLIVE